MTRQPPPYGPPLVAPRPPKPRPSAWWFGLGIALVLSAVAAGIGLLVWTLSAFLPTDVEVPRVGEPPAVEVSTDAEQMLWTYDVENRPECRVTDRVSGERVGLRRPGGQFRRSAGKPGDRVGTWRFDPGSGDLEVTCNAPQSIPRSTVEIGPAPRISSFVVGILATIVVPLLLFLAGVTVLVVRVRKGRLELVDPTG